jgi:hypothetical protein
LAIKTYLIFILNTISILNIDFKQQNHILLSPFCFAPFQPIKFCKKRQKADPRSPFQRFLQNKILINQHFNLFYMEKGLKNTPCLEYLIFDTYYTFSVSTLKNKLKTIQNFFLFIENFDIY